MKEEERKIYLKDISKRLLQKYEKDLKQKKEVKKKLRNSRKILKKLIIDLGRIKRRKNQKSIPHREGKR